MFEREVTFYDALTQCAESHYIFSSPQQKISFIRKNKKFVYVIRDGVVDIRRNVDDIIVLTVHAPAVLGLTSIFSGNFFHYISTVTHAEIVAIPVDVAFAYIEENNLWRRTAVELAKAAQLYYRRDEIVSGSSVYEVIKKHLEVLWGLPESERTQISIFDYIMSRSNISRSSLNKVLKDLSLGEYIIMQRGRLKDLKRLPKNY